MCTALSSIKHRIRVSDDTRYLTSGQIRERFGVSDMWIFRHIRDHNFPKPIKLGGPSSARARAPNREHLAFDRGETLPTQ
jgi:predicted DNA-binding transcriptional regulator AlpA